MKNKTIITVLIILLVILGFWYFQNQDNEPAEQNQETTNTPQKPSNNNSTGSTSNEPDEEEEPNLEQPEDESILVGTLQKSDNAALGNLMLLLDDADRIVYINTGRDFSELIDKHVKVQIDGTLSDFTLVNITEIETTQVN